MDIPEPEDARGAIAVSNHIVSLASWSFTIDDDVIEQVV